MACDPQALATAAACILECLRGEPLNRAAMISVLCDILDGTGGGGGGSTCNSVMFKTTTLDTFTYDGFNTDSDFEFPNLTNVGTTFEITSNSVTPMTLSAPKLGVGGAAGFAVTSAAGFAAVNLVALNSVGGDFALLDNSTGSLTALNLSSLVSVGGGLTIFMKALNSLNLVSLTTVSGGGNPLAITNSKLVILNLTALTAIGSGFDFSSNAQLQSINLPNAVVLDTGADCRASGCALNVTSINQILRRLVVSGMTNAVIDLSGGTNAAPTGQGLTDKATLIGNGCTVTTN